MEQLLSRRTFTALGLGTLAGFALSRRGNAQGDQAAGGAGELFFGWREVMPGVRMASEQGGNALLIAGGGTGGRSVLIDCKNPGFGPTLRREAESFGVPLAMAINTHHHWDHVGGNTEFTKDLPLVAHKNAKQRVLDQLDKLVSAAVNTVDTLKTAPRPIPQKVRDEVAAYAEWVPTIKGEEFAPTRLIEKEEETISVGGLEVVLRHFGPGHTDNDLVVFVPSLNLVHMGDLLFRKLHPFIDRPAGADTKRWQTVLGKVASMCDDKTVVIPGHGDPTDRSGLVEQAEYFDKMREVVRHAMKVEGMSKMEVGGLNPGAVGDYGFAQIRPRTLTAIYEEIEAEDAASKIPATR